jgi:predicted PurR-regulated permease PerM
VERDRWTRAAIVLVAINAAIFLFEKICQLSGFFGDIILIFALAWLTTFALAPLVDGLTGRLVPRIFTRWVRRRRADRVANALESIRLPHGLAVSLVYLGLVVFMVVIGTFWAPVIVTQFSQLGAKLPEYIAQAPKWLETLQERLARFNIYIDLMSIYQPEELSRRAEIIGAAIIQNTLVFVTQVVSGVANAFIVIILSFYMMLDGKRVAKQALALIPAEYYDELSVAAKSLDRTFGGFVRSQLVTALLYAVFVTLTMTIAELRFAVAIGSLAGLIMLIPYIGAPIAMVLPAIIALFQHPSLALWILLIMAVYQQILLHIVMSKVMSEAVGMPQLLISVAMMISSRLIGIWGFIFGIPVAGALYATGIFFLNRWKAQQRRSLG